MSSGTKASPGGAATRAALSWDLVGAFLAVMRTGSLSGAARALGVAQPTVRRQIEELEEALGVVLFTRSPTGLLATEAAHGTLPYAESMAGVAEALVRSVSAPDAAEEGTVRVTCSEIIGVEVLPPMIAELRRAHPRLQIELSPTNASEDLLRRDADVAVRMVQPTQGALVARRVGTVEVGLFASEAYLAAHPAPRTSAELLGGHALIGRDRDASFFQAFAEAGVPLRRQDCALRTDSDAAQVASIRAGVGIGVCQVALAARSPGLRRVLPEVGFGLPVWVVTHEDLRSSQRVSIVFEHLVASLAAYARPAVDPDDAPSRRGRRARRR
jgi:DNA-binding transcriptional LysR family regulator